MFSTEHFIWLGICAVIIGLLLFFSLKFKWNINVATYIMAGVSLASELLKIFTHIQDNGYIEAGALPLHLCSIFIFVFFYLALSKNEKNKGILRSFFVPVGLFGALLAIIMATSGVNFAKPFAYQCFIFHAVMLYYALYLIITKQVDLGLKVYIRNLIVLFSLAMIMIWVNGALQSYDTNFFFVVRPPASGLPVLNLNHGWFVYFCHLACTGVILETLVSLPYIIKEKKNS